MLLKMLFHKRQNPHSLLTGHEGFLSI